MKVNLSINPTYLCNFRCKFCYLTPEQLSDANTVDLNVLRQRLGEVFGHGPIDHVDLYGGEVGLLNQPYMDELLGIIHDYYTGPIEIITNFYKMHPAFYRDDVRVSVSFDLMFRERYTDVLNNITLFPKDIHILMLASEGLVQTDPDFAIQLFSNLKNVKSVEIKPYSTNQANVHNVSFSDFEEYVKKWIEYPGEKNFQFINEKNIKRSLNKEYSAWSDDHLYITPSGKFAVLDFDEHDNEYFQELNNYEEYIKWAATEKEKVFANSYCNQCEYLGNCLSEHLRNVQSLENSCNGFKHLLDWYSERTERT